MNLVHYFSFYPVVTIFGSIFRWFWPPFEVQSMPKVPIWTLTPSYSVWAGDQPKIWTWLLILFRFFDFPFILSFLVILGLWGDLCGTFVTRGGPQDPYEVVYLNNYPPPVSDFAASSIFRFRGILGFASLRWSRDTGQCFWGNSSKDMYQAPMYFAQLESCTVL